jgi:hypothetical protein
MKTPEELAQQPKTINEVAPSEQGKELARAQPKRQPPAPSPPYVSPNAVSKLSTI